jgi:hypothetical protein
VNESWYSVQRPVVAGGHVLDHLERVVALIAFEFDEGHAASTAPLKWKCARHWTSPRARLRFDAGTTGVRRLTQDRESAGAPTIDGSNRSAKTAQQPVKRVAPALMK